MRLIKYELRAQENITAGGEREAAGILLKRRGKCHPFGTMLEASEEFLDKVLGVNLKRTMLCNKAAATRMIKQGTGGKIINIASGAALRPSGVLKYGCGCVFSESLIFVCYLLAEPTHRKRVPGFMLTAAYDANSVDGPPHGVFCAELSI